jgi:amino acid transporter
MQITKIFPVPPLVFACSFAWVFVTCSTSVANALNFAIYANYPETDNPNEWKVKFIACVMVVTVAGLHYRKVNLGIWVNNGLAFYKVLFLGILTLAGFAATCRDAARGKLEGLSDFATTFEDDRVTPTNVVLGFLLVLFSYDGWENASELDEQKTRSAMY